MRSRVDWIFVAAISALVGWGSIVLLSAASPLPHYSWVLQRHYFALVVGGLLFMFGLGLNYQVYQDQARVIYGVILTLMAAVLLFGSASRGQRAWFHAAGFAFQPSEVARIGLILVLANFLDRSARKIGELSTVLQVLAVAAPVLAMILKEPDFSSTMTLFPVIIGMLFCAGVDLLHLTAVIGYAAITMALPLLYTSLALYYPAAASGSLPALLLQVSHMGMGMMAALLLVVGLAVAAWKFSSWMHWQVKPVLFVGLALVGIAGIVSGDLANRQIKGYQRNRLIAFVAPQADVQGASYNVHQSQIAIGSGGVWGKGLFSGTQSHLGFLPERHTDFIYAVVGEEMGFWGAGAILALYMLLIWRIVVAGRLARDRYGFLVCSGVASTLSFSLIVNVGMCLGLMPVLGIPLPLVSYGGSSLVFTLWGLGIVANIHAKRYLLL